MAHGIIWWIVVGLLAGWAAGKIMRRIWCHCRHSAGNRRWHRWRVGRWPARLRQRGLDLERPSHNTRCGDPDLDYQAYQEGSLRSELSS